MNETRGFLDDPQITAYALGELSDEQRAAVEAKLRGDAEARRAVEEIRAAAARLEEALVAEDARQTVDNPGETDPYARPKKGRVLAFPQIYYVVGGLAAACFAVVVAWHEEPQKDAAKKVHHEIVLAPDAVAVGLPMSEAEPLIGGNAGAGASATTGAPDVFAMEMPKVDLSAESLAAENYERAMREKGAGRKARESRITGSVLGQPRMASTGTAFVDGAAGAVLYRSRNATAGSAMDATRADAEHETEAYSFRRDNGFLAVAENPLSTFSADVDTAGYSNVRRYLESGRRPPVDAVRIEELVNYFPYRYPAPVAAGEEEPAAFAAALEVAEAPWAPDHRLVRIGLKGREVASVERGAANLVFLVDVSGSMDMPQKLPLVKESLRLLLARLRPDDRVAIVTYAGASGLALPSTPVDRSQAIEQAIEAMAPAGSTNGAMGIHLAYDIAKANFVTGGVNRVILCTDGDFNVGVTSEGELVRLIEEKAKSQVFLTVLGFGMGNLKDSTLQQIANRGNGSYGYIDTRREAEKLLVEQVSGTLVPIAKDVKFQVEFNPAQVAQYRLIGYEKRMLSKEDFANDQVDAGEVGAGHAVTALYEIVPAHAQVKAPAELEDLRYAKVDTAPVETRVPEDVVHELLTVKVRYKAPDGEVSRKLEFPLVDSGQRFAEASDDFKFAAAVAGFGMLLRDSESKGAASFAAVAQWAESGAGYDPGGYRAEFVQMVRKARAL